MAFLFHIMQPEPIILFPTTHEQSNPTFHVEATQFDAFLAFLQRKGLQAWEPPQRLEKLGPDQKHIIEVQLNAETPENYLETLLKEFREEQKIS